MCDMTLVTDYATNLDLGMLGDDLSGQAHLHDYVVSTNRPRTLYLGGRTVFMNLRNYLERCRVLLRTVKFHADSYSSHTQSGFTYSVSGRPLTDSYS